MTIIEGAVAVVTGSASGVGRGIAEALIAAGAKVVIADLEEDRATVVADEIGAAASFGVDVSNRLSVDQLATNVRKRFGHVDILVNNAGVASVARLDEMTNADWDWLLGVNLHGVINGVAAFLPLIREGANGHIVNTGSMAGLVAGTGLGAYGATKFAVTAFTEVLAKELESSGIRVTLLAPGPVRSDLGTSSRNRPAGSFGGLRDADLSAGDGVVCVGWTRATSARSQ